jgi:hypothetical protein
MRAARMRIVHHEAHVIPPLVGVQKKAWRLNQRLVELFVWSSVTKRRRIIGFQDWWLHPPLRIQ